MFAPGGFHQFEQKPATAARGQESMALGRAIESYGDSTGNVKKNREAGDLEFARRI